MRHGLSMPKDEYGDRDRKATKALKNILPDHWKFKSPRDVDSGDEVCRDWIVEIANAEHGWSGAEFSIQNKTNPTIHEEHVSVVLRVDCVIYLLDKVTHPVMIHAYDIDSETSYWIWLSRWEGVNERSKWNNQKQKGVSIQIPKSNILTKASVSEIEAFVRESHFKASVRNRVDTANLSNPDFKFSSPEFVDNNIFSIAQPKHDKAKFNFTVDTEGNEAIRRALEEGYIVQFPLISGDLPSPIEPAKGEDNRVIVTLLPHIPDIVMPCRLIFLDAENEVSLEHKYIAFKMVRPGAVEKEFVGQPSNFPIVYSIVTRPNEDSSLVDAKLNFYCSDPRNPIAAKAFCDLYDNLRLSKRVRIIHLELDTHLAEFDLQNLPAVDEKVRRYIEAVYSLKINHNIHVPVSAELSDEALFSVEFCSQILEYGKSHWVFNRSQGTWKIPIEQAPKIIDTFKQEGYVPITTNASHIEIGIIDTKIDLGMLRSIYFVKQFNNLGEIEARIASENVDDDFIPIDIEIDFEKSFTEQVKST
jgi:hypothetical protein